jgi:L-iditol 2-dehydrogenase
MKVGQLAGPGVLRLNEVPPPTAGPGEVIVRLAACGICGTDLEKLRGHYEDRGIIGHEPVGVIAGLGRGVQGLEVGTRVFVHHHVPCYHCPVCDQGEYTFCPEYSKSNLDPGGFAELFRVPVENVERNAIVKLDPKVSWTAGALIEPAGCVLTALHRVGFRRGDSVMILGLGPVGLLYARLTQALGARWIGGAEISTLRRTVAERGGVTTFDPRQPDLLRSGVGKATEGIGVDHAVVATGAPAALRLAEDLPRRGGTINLFGLPEPGTHLGTDLQKLYRSGIRLIPTYATTETDIAEVHRMAVDGSLRLDDLVSHTFPLDQITEAFAMASKPEEALKVVVTGPAAG